MKLWIIPSRNKPNEDNFVDAVLCFVGERILTYLNPSYSEK